jgi:phosphoadenosine phosphosulfate reductase
MKSASLRGGEADVVIQTDRASSTAGLDCHSALAITQELEQGFPALSLSERLNHLATLPGRKVFTTSLGLEDQVLTHLIVSHGLDIEIVTLDTGRLFSETYTLWQETEERYGRRIQAFYPQAQDLQDWVHENGINAFYTSVEARKACCGLRKVEPLARALEEAALWITGLRADQSQNRSSTRFAEWDEARSLLKINPLLDQTREALQSFCEAHSIPVNALHAKGFLSIGCAPCTRAIEPWEDERAGRWWWENEDKKECGLHVGADGKLVRVTG